MDNGIYPLVGKGYIKLSLSPKRRSPKPEPYSNSKASRYEAIKARLEQGGIWHIGLFDESLFRFYGHGRLKGDVIEFVDMNEPCESDTHYIDLPDSLTTQFPEHMYLLSYQELVFVHRNFDSFKMQVSPSLALGPFGYGLEVHTLAVKMTSVMEEGDEDQMEDETELVRVLHGKHHTGKDHPILFGRIDYRFPFYFAPNRQGFIKFEIEEPFRRWNIVTRSEKNHRQKMKEMADEE